MSPATFRRTSHDQKVALSSGRTLSYHTPLPMVDNAMVESQRSVANSIPASGPPPCTQDRKSTRLNSSHSQISYAVFCLKKKKKQNLHTLIEPSISIHRV